MRLYEDDFATAVHSRSFTHLAAPAFGGAMMG